MFPPEMETDRLRLVRLCRENTPTRELYRWMKADAPAMDEIREYVAWEPHRTMKDTHEYLTEVEERWESREQATYAMYPREGRTARERSPGRRTSTWAGRSGPANSASGSGNPSGVAATRANAPPR